LEVEYIEIILVIASHVYIAYTIHVNERWLYNIYLFELFAQLQHAFVKLNTVKTLYNEILYNEKLYIT
jgi:hypothetical protein